MYNNLDAKTNWERGYYSAPGVYRARYYDGRQDSDLDSNTLSLGTRFKPLNNLLLTSRMRYEYSETSSTSQWTRDGRHYAPPYYNGDSNSFITTVNYALNEKTTLSSQFQRWSADETDAVLQGGLSLGLERPLKEDLLLKFEKFAEK